MKITASYLYPDFSYKRKYTGYCTKKSVKKKGKSFEEYLQNLRNEIDNGNHKDEKVI